MGCIGCFDDIFSIVCCSDCLSQLKLWCIWCSQLEGCMLLPPLGERKSFPLLFHCPGLDYVVHYFHCWGGVASPVCLLPYCIGCCYLFGSVRCVFVFTLVAIISYQGQWVGICSLLVFPFFCCMALTASISAALCSANGTGFASSLLAQAILALDFMWIGGGHFQGALGPGMVLGVWGKFPVGHWVVLSQHVVGSHFWWIHAKMAVWGGCGLNGGSCTGELYCSSCGLWELFVPKWCTLRTWYIVDGGILVLEWFNILRGGVWSMMWLWFGDHHLLRCIASHFFSCLHSKKTACTYIPSVHTHTGGARAWNLKSSIVSAFMLYSTVRTTVHTYILLPRSYLWYGTSTIVCYHK